MTCERSRDFSRYQLTVVRVVGAHRAGPYQVIGNCRCYLRNPLHIVEVEHIFQDHPAVGTEMTMCFMVKFGWGIAHGAIIQ